jgi:hypothetical protein
MHRVIPTIRRIVPNDLPRVRDDAGEVVPATSDQLANLGYLQLDGDLYSVLEQHASEVVPDPVTGGLKRNWLVDVPGESIGEGPPARRFAALPSDVRDRVLKAYVARATAPGESAKQLVADSLGEQLAAIAANVGDLENGAQLLDASAPATTAAEATRLAAIESNSIAIEVVSRDTIDLTSDVVIHDGVFPQLWAGELAPPTS